MAAQSVEGGVLSVCVGSGQRSERGARTVLYGGTDCIGKDRDWNVLQGALSCPAVHPLPTE